MNKLLPLVFLLSSCSFQADHTSFVEQCLKGVYEQFPRSEPGTLEIMTRKELNSRVEDADGELRLIIPLIASARPPSMNCKESSGVVSINTPGFSGWDVVQ